MIVIASDHGGYALKQELMAHLKEKGVEFEDIGTYSEASCNYPEYAERAARGQHRAGAAVARRGDQLERRRRRQDDDHGRGHHGTAPARPGNRESPATG